jgi:Flp pilus assembly protein TadG
MGRQTRNGRRGNQAIEFALVVPVLTAITSGLVDYGWYFVQEHVTLAAVRDATRIAAAYPLSSDPAAVAQAKVNEFLDDQKISGKRTVAAAIVGDPGELRVRLEVTVDYLPMMGVVPSPEQLHGTLEMYLENQDRPVTLALESSTGSSTAY